MLCLNFGTHKYGQHMGNLRVDIDTGSVSPKWVVGVMLVAGQKHSSSSQPWSKALINLDPYFGPNHSCAIPWEQEQFLGK